LKDDIARVYVEGAAELDAMGGYLSLDTTQLSDPSVSLKIVRGNEVSRQHALDVFSENVEISLNENIQAPVEAGDVLGSLSFTTHDGKSVTAQLAASRSVEKQPDPTPTPEPTRAPIISFDGNGRLGSVVVTLIVLFVIILIIGVILSLVASARRKKRRRLMEKRRREQQRRQVQMRRSNTYPEGRGRQTQSSRNIDRYRR